MPLRDSSYTPVCTLRVQLHQKFAFAELAGLLPYFASLGVADFYLSPIFTSTPGSLHGYDVIDYSRVNPELGGADGFDRLSAAVREAGGGVLLDFVPNHMGIEGLLNRWWRETLELGARSPHAKFFDIHWNEEEGGGRPRVLAPVLEDHYGRELEKGKIVLACDGALSLRYGILTFPVSPDSYPLVLQPVRDACAPGPERERLAGLIAQFARIRQRGAEKAAALKRELAALLAENPATQAVLTGQVSRMNGREGDPRSFDELDALIERQHYRLARWQAGTHEINYRRFFAIDSLVGLHMENPDVFRETHALLSRFVRDGKVAGLRIDHIDGLRQPEDYLRRLQAMDRPNPSRPLYVAVEKILAAGEKLPEPWPVHGETGYEFILQLAGVLVEAGAEQRCDDIYRRLTGEQDSYTASVLKKKRLILDEMFGNAVERLGSDLAGIAAGDRRWRDLTRHELTEAISELMVHMPVYRTYRRRLEPVSAPDRRVLDEACARAEASNPRADPQPIRFVRDLLAGDYPKADASAAFRARVLGWVLTFQQQTGAVAAKSVEDTAYYTYNRLVALNEVGGDPSLFGGSVAGFHEANAARLAECPRAMVATSTHDTKWSEDVRARLYALSEIADEWDGWARQWLRLTARHLTAIQGRDAPDDLDRFRLFQVLLGVWPLDESWTEEEFRVRLKTHCRKAVSEAKRHTSIVRTNEAYLDACDHFVEGLVVPERDREFLGSFRPCAQRVARLGMVNALAQLVLKCTVPGIPDFYQGCEIWNLSLVDPDNRRPVDYGRCQAALAAAATRSPAELLAEWRDGAIKIWTMQRLLALRRRQPAVFPDGRYRPLAAEGAFADRAIAFAREAGGASVVVAVPRLASKLGEPPVGAVWDDTRLAAPPAPGPLRDIFTGRSFAAGDPLLFRELFAALPFAVLEGASGHTESKP